MKHTPILILLLLLATTICAQSVTFTYDNAGNRTARVITMPPKSKSPVAPQEPEEEIIPFSDMIAEQAIRIYPNPTDGILVVEIEGYTDEIKAEFRLMDMSGSLISAGKATTGYNTLDLSRQATGIYLLQITINGESVVWRIIKK
jgi:hypothetical protein